MIDISSFVLRWMFLSNLCRDIMEIQTLPSILYHHHNHNPTSPASPHNNNYYNQQHQQTQFIEESNYQQQQQQLPDENNQNTDNNLSQSSSPNYYQKLQAHERQPGSDILSVPRHQATQERQQQQQNPIQRIHNDDGVHFHQQRQPSSNSAATSGSPLKTNILDNMDNTRYKEQCWRNILSYPPNSYQRCGTINTLRNQLVQELYNRIQHDTTIVQQYHRENHNNQEILCDDNEEKLRQDITNNITSTKSSQQQNQTQNISLNDYIIAKRSLLLFRQYLPQLISIILKSPPPLKTISFGPSATSTATVVQFDREDNSGSRSDTISDTNPIQLLRHIILQQCVYDASIGIEICWLLEAEVGKTWKTLFEHKQQTGRRLIIVLPTDKAIVLAKIGIEKREAFDLLQDAEQATAFGYTESNVDTIVPTTLSQSLSNPVLEHVTPPTRLPSSLSLRRCSHFGDTMQFIDRLSKISSDLRMIPTQYRYNILHEQLHELNRRLRRRMISRGDISLDVDDYRSPYDWPQIEDMSVDMIVHSVHLPLIPQVPTWPNGENDNKAQQQSSSMPNTEVVRVLNIVVHESKLLSSRERCPFLIHVEVVDAGLEGNDARLYCTGASDIGSTIGEALGMMNSVKSKVSEHPTLSDETTLQEDKENIPSQSRRNILHYSIPDELLPQQIGERAILANVGIEGHTQVVETDSQKILDRNSNAYVRGGSQSEMPFYNDGHDVMPGGYMVDPFDVVRQQEYEQLHYHLHTQRPYETMSIPPMYSPPIIPKLSVGNDLLDNVFGREWREKCKEIRDLSPYGHIKGWRLSSFIMKAGEDIRRESFVMQIITKLKSWFDSEIPEDIRPYMRPYTIMCVGGDAGLLECLSDAKSVDEVKKRTDGYTSLRDYFERAYGVPRKPAFIPTTSDTTHKGGEGRMQSIDPFGLRRDASSNRGRISFETAQHNFLRSLVGYSLVCYILQIKDRHNANILLDRMGHIMHIDFGYVLGDTPKMGKVPIFSERAPFKLSNDFWEVLGGWNMAEGGLGVKFCKMFELAFQCASNHADEIAALTEAAALSLDSNPRNARSTANSVRSRLRMRGAPGSREQKLFIMELVNAALTSWGTSTYDWLQRNMNGYQ